MRSIFQGLSVSLLALAVAGCTTPNPTALDRPGDVPTAFTAPATTDSNAPLWPSLTWWDNFSSPELSALMATAQKENLNITIAALNVLEAEANDTVAFSSLLPNLGLSASARDGGTDTSKGNGSYSAGLAGSYVLDFFGANRDRLIQAHETLRSTRYAQTVTGLTTESSVATTYFEILSLRERIAITRQNLDLARNLLAVVQNKFAAGVSSNLDVATETATVAQTESTLPPLIEQEREARYSLAILLGLPPEGFDIKAQNLNDIVSPSVQAGLPSELLLRNPTVAEAEANLYASHANVDAARAAFFPTISLSASGSSAASEIGSLFNPGTLAWSLGASLAQTIFDGGAIKAHYDSAKAAQGIEIATYRNAVFTAFSTAESALGSIDSVNKQLDLIGQYEKAAAEAERISDLQYREGTIDITTLIQAQQSLFNAQTTLSTTKLSRLTSNINLYIALGGGWDQKSSDTAYKPQLEWWPL
jgi:multidrug efflux system outer membrane protein